MSGSLERLALRVLLASFPGPRPHDAAGDLLDDGLAGLCLFGSNTGAGPAAVQQVTSRVHEHEDALVAVDEEGGDVTRLHAGTGSPWLGAGALGSADDIDLTRGTAHGIGTELAGLGIDLTLAPVADVNSNPDNPVIGIRSFGADAARVAEHVAAWVTGLQAAGPVACAKHFPGHGDTAQDSHLALPVVATAPELLAERELAPFRAAVAAGVAAVMTSHIVVTAFDDRPATLSGPVLELLRRSGFTGVIVSDALDMTAVSSGPGVTGAAVAALAAGCDLLCLGPDQDVGLVRSVQDAICAAVRDGQLAEERLAEAAARVGELARRGASGPGEERFPDQLVGARAALRTEGRLPDLRDAGMVRIESSPNIAVGDVPWGIPSGSTRAVDELDGHEGAAGPVIVQARDAHRHPQLVAWLDRQPSDRVVLVEWGWPGPLPGPDGRLCRVIPYGSALPSRQAVTEVLLAAGWSG